VGIGTATPGVRVDILSDNNTSLAAVLRVNSNNAAVNTVLAYDGLIASGGMTLQAGTSSPIIFNTNAANERYRIASDGVATWSNVGGVAGTAMTLNSTGLNIANGNVILGTSGKGIDFTAAGNAAGMTSELLNDYEEGTFTPSLATDDINFTSVGYTTQTAKYTKVGNLVTIAGTIQTNSVVKGAANGAVVITGLPFTQPSTNARGGVNCFDAQSWLADAPLSGDINGTRIFLLKRATSVSASANLAVADVSTGAANNIVRFSGQYYV
jgi:hypothetical protein